MQHLVLLGTGGTIATREAEGGRRVEVGARALAEAAGSVFDLGDLDVRPRDLSGIPSFAATVPDVLRLADAVAEAAAEADGVVLTHGTDTLEEVAFLLALSHSGPRPVVLTGAQRPFDDPAPDGPRNLAAALRWAASPEAVEGGVTVAFADQILPAIGVRKSHTLSLHAFDAPGYGPVGRVDEAGVRRRGATRPHPLLPAGTQDLPRVDVVCQYLGADASALDNAVSAGAQGVVVAGFGSGNTTPETTRACLRLLADGVPVLVTSRTGAGPVLNLYAGASADLAAAGAVFAGDLSPWQARLLLASALVAENEPGAATQRCRDWLHAAGVVASPSRANA